MWREYRLAGQVLGNSPMFPCFFRVDSEFIIFSSDSASCQPIAGNQTIEPILWGKRVGALGQKGAPWAFCHRQQARENVSHFWHACRNSGAGPCPPTGTARPRTIVSRCLGVPPFADAYPPCSSPTPRRIIHFRGSTKRVGMMFHSLMFGLKIRRVCQGTTRRPRAAVEP